MANGFVLLINALENDEERQELRINMRHLRDQSDPLSLPETIFRGIFRIKRQTALDLIRTVSPFLRRLQRSDGIPHQLKVLASLQFFAQGSYQKSVGDDYNFPMSQSSISRCIKEVSTVICENMHHLICFPQNDRERVAEKQKFLERGGFPGTIGAIDCTHIAIIAPPTDHPQFPGILFYNRKSFYSLNVQIICSADLKILAINARYPGSVHDSAIWLTSGIRRIMKTNFEAGDDSSWVIGDSGYPLEPWLMTPIPVDNNADDNQRQQIARYNSAHRSARNVIERLNGVLKAKFRCLIRHRVLHYDPISAARIINCCAILYNLCWIRGEIDDYENEEPEIDEPRNVRFQVDNANLLHRGRIIRNRILRNHFN